MIVFYLSGGKIVFQAHILVKKYGLKPLAVTFIQLVHRSWSL